MNLYLTVEGRPYPAHSHRVLDMLGVKRLPPEGMPERQIQGIAVWVNPHKPKTYSTWTIFRLRRRWSGPYYTKEAAEATIARAVEQGWQHLILREKKRPIKTSTHRVYGRCPACGKEMSVGRLPQHAVVHKSIR